MFASKNPPETISCGGGFVGIEGLLSAKTAILRSPEFIQSIQLYSVVLAPLPRPRFFVRTAVATNRFWFFAKFSGEER